MKTTLLPMTKTACLASLFCASFSAGAQAPAYSWANGMGATGADLGIRMTTDAMGNTYTTGSFTGTVDFDPDATDASPLTAASGTDIFVCKFDASGDFIWAVNMGGTDDDAGQSIAADAAGNVYLTGTFKGTADFNLASPGVNTLTSAGGTDIFVCKLSSTGAYTWVVGTGSVSDDAGNAIVLDASDNILVAGNFGAMSTVDFDPDPTDSEPLTSFGGSDDFIWKMDNNADFIFVKQMGGTVNDLCNAIGLDASGNIFVAGSFNGVSDFDPDATGSTTLTSAGSNDIFVCKLDAAGNFQWVRGMGAATTDIALALVVDHASNVIISGSFAGTVDFDPDVSFFVPLTASGLSDPFACKFDGTGDFIWARHFTGSGFDRGSGLAVDAANSIYVTGAFASTMDFNPDATATANLTSAGGNDVFICKLDATGAYEWAISMGGTGDDAGQSVQLAAGKIFVAGRYSATADFNPDATVTNNLVSAGSTDIFVAQYAPPCTPTDSTITATGCGSYTLNDTTYTAGGTHTQILANAAGCDSTITLNLTINTVDITTSTSGVTITAAASGAAYQWINCTTNLPIAGATAQSFTALANGNYAVIVTQGGCSDTSACTSITGVGLNNPGNKTLLAAYPNPSGGQLIISSSQQGKMVITNINGKTVYTSALVTGHNQFDLTNLTPGVYVIQLAGNGQKLKWIKL